MTGTERGSAGEKSLSRRLAALGVREDDLEESFTRSGGHGGQNVNKTSTCVRIIHRPSGIEVRCQTHRRQGMNRMLARWLLVEKLESVRRQAAEQARALVERERRRKRPRSRAAKETMLAGKARRSAVKAMRRLPADA